MSIAPAAFAKAARSLVGTPFRLRGRNPASGVDCIGLVAVSLERCGSARFPLPRYELRNTDIHGLLRLLPEAGFGPASDKIAAGDLLLTRPGPAQHHLAIATGKGSFIHAHAGLGRVVETPAPLPWPVAGHWRLIPS